MCPSPPLQVLPCLAQTAGRWPAGESGQGPWPSAARRWSGRFCWPTSSSPSWVWTSYVISSSRWTQLPTFSTRETAAAAGRSIPAVPLHHLSRGFVLSRRGRIARPLVPLLSRGVVLAPVGQIARPLGPHPRAATVGRDETAATESPQSWMSWPSSQPW